MGQNDRDRPVNVAIPNMAERKMDAICALAMGMEILAKAIVGPVVTVNITGNRIVLDKDNPAPAINVENLNDPVEE
jgi:hypothetical protein